MKRLGSRLLRLRAVGETARRMASRRGLSLVLVYHRVEPDDHALSGVIPRVTRSTLAHQLEVLDEIGEVVGLHDTLEGGRGRMRFAVTFDDDYGSHVDVALPVLRDGGVPAAFFLSGRALHGLGPYWFVALDELIRSRGLRPTAHSLGVEAAAPHDLAAACEGNADLCRRLEAQFEGTGDLLRHQGIRTLADAGMTIGFHTLEHAALPRLSDEEMAATLLRGREELGRAAGDTPTLFAYPHGKADERSARAVRDAGYVAAWTGRPAPMSPEADRFLLGRWEPGSLEAEDFIARITVRLLRASDAGA